MTHFGPRFASAIAYAIELDDAQVRKATSIPYVSHLLSVCALVLEDGATEDEAIAALLHDGPEDQGEQATLDEIRRGSAPKSRSWSPGSATRLSGQSRRGASAPTLWSRTQTSG